MRFGRAVIAVCLFACAFASAAQASPQVQLRLSAFLLPAGQSHAAAAPLGSRPVQAGDRVRFIIKATNTGNSAAYKLTPSDPIPAHMSYVVGSAKDEGAAVEFTVDGKTWAARPAVALKTRKGSVRKAADPSLYKAIRWVSHIPLRPHGTFVYSFEARVNGHRTNSK